MGGTDTDRSDIAARPKPPLPPKPPLFKKPNGVVDPSVHNFMGVLSTDKHDEEMTVQNFGTAAEHNKTKECGVHEVVINTLPDSAEPSVSRSGVTVHSMEKSASHIESSSANNSLPPSFMSTSSDTPGTKRTVTRGRPPRRTSRHSIENGESGDEACCIKFAGMLRTKAVDMASKSKILPPAKPPKPDNLVKLKGRRRKGSQQNGLSCQHSVGDDFSIDGSRHGVRFVDDDETESSTDYKDFDENSVFLLELACHCDAQNISVGTGILSEGMESGYYTSDIVKTDEETNLSDINHPFDNKDKVHEVSKQTIASACDEKVEILEKKTSLFLLSDENALIESPQELNNQAVVKEDGIVDAEKEHPVSSDAALDSEKYMPDSSDSLLPCKASVENEEQKKIVCDSYMETAINGNDENISPHTFIPITDSSITETKQTAAFPVKQSSQKPKRVKSPPRPPPPQIKKQPEPVLTTEQNQEDVITKEELVPHEETATNVIKEEEATSASTVLESVESEKLIPTPEVPQTKKRVTSPPRPPPPKIKEITVNKKDDDETKETKQNIDLSSKKKRPPIPIKPDRKRKDDLHDKSSLEPLDLSTKDDLGKCEKPSLSPKTFPRSGRQVTKLGRPNTMTNQVKKMEFPMPLKHSEQTGSKPVMTTVVRNTYLDGLQPLPLVKPTSEKKLSPSRPPPPSLSKTEENISHTADDSAMKQDSSMLTETRNDLSETVQSVDVTSEREHKEEAIESKENLSDAKDHHLDESLVDAQNDSSVDIQEVIVPSADIPLENIETSDKLESMAMHDAFVRDEVQFSTWPIAAERKKRKQMKSPPRPPPPSKDTIISRDPSLLPKDVFPKQAYETSSLDTRGRKRIQSPPKPPPPRHDKLPLKTEGELVSGTDIHLEEKVNRSDAVDENDTKRLKSPPRPPPPIYQKLPLRRICVNQSISQTNEIAKPFPSDRNNEIHKSPLTPPQIEKTVSKTTEHDMTNVPLAKEETITEDVDLSSCLETKKRVVSPPRPPPPVYEKLSLRRTDKPMVSSSTTPRTKKPNETSDKQFMSLQRPPPVSNSTSHDQQFSSETNVLHEYEEIQPPDEECLDTAKVRPKPPPRVRRNRSRTVEVVSVTEKPEERKRRSHSLTEADVMKKLEDRGLLSTPQRSEMKTLYTTVQKEHGKMKIKEIDTNEEGRRTPGFDKMKLRPLPPPPPPPRCRSRSSMSQSPASIGLNTSVSEVTLDATQKDSCSRTEQTDLPEYDENANISLPLSKIEEQNKQEISHEKERIQDQTSESKVPHRKSHSPPSARSKSPSPSKHRSCSSWYDESDVSGDLGDVDTSSSIKGSAEAINKDDSESTMPKQKQAKAKGDQSGTSTFYCDFEDDAFHDCAAELSPTENERPVSSSSLVEKSVQTSPERELTLSSQERDNQSDDTDDLLDRARTVQMELCLMLERRKRKKGHAGEDDTKSSCSYTPSPKSTIPRTKVKIISDPIVTDHLPDIESPLTASPVEGRGQLSSLRSSNSELGWQVLSSDESDEDSDKAFSILLQKRKQKAFHIANEIMTSEETFVSALKLLNEDFRQAVDKANKERGGTVISEEVINSFLKYFPQLQHLNENLLSELKERIEHWEESGKIADIIVKIGPFLKLYSSYIRDFDAMEAALDDARRKYPLFDQVTKEFEAGPQCKKLSVKHFMLKPIQRIPLYRLLLQQYLHNLTPESSDYNDTLTALQIVSEVADHANETLRQGDNFQKLISIQNSLFGQYEVIRPGRVFLKEGELMKLSRKDMQPRWFILFNDSLLYLTSMQQGLFKVNNELPLAGMKVHIPQQQDYQNEFSIISVTRSFTLAARSLEERQEWIDALNKAIEENASKRNTFANIMMQRKGKDKQTDGSFILGKQAPVWVPDARVTMCQLCTSEFTVTFRRHHCRACGKVVCSLCSANQAPLQYRNFSVARVCDECFEKLQKEFEATEPGEKVAEESGSCSEIAETDSDSPQAMASIKAQFKGNVKNVGKKNKRQLPSVLKEVCANDQGSTISGYLHRKHRKYWKRFWFVLKDKVLYTYKASEDVAALESVPLLGFRVEMFTKPLEGIEPERFFQLTHPGQDPIIFHADTIVSAERWIQAMQHATILE